MLDELFTSSGTGTMLVRQLDTYERIVRGVAGDRDRIMAFLADCGVFSDPRAIVPEDFVVLWEDDEIRATACLTQTGHAACLTSIAVSSHQYFDSVVSRLIDQVIALARKRNIRELSVGLDFNQSWLLISQAFAEAGFTPSGGDVVWHLTFD